MDSTKVVAKVCDKISVLLSEGKWDCYLALDYDQNISKARIRHEVLSLCQGDVESKSLDSAAIDIRKLQH